MIEENKSCISFDELLLKQEAPMLVTDFAVKQFHLNSWILWIRGILSSYLTSLRICQSRSQISSCVMRS